MAVTLGPAPTAGTGWSESAIAQKSEVSTPFEVIAYGTVVARAEFATPRVPAHRPGSSQTRNFHLPGSLRSSSS